MTSSIAKIACIVAAVLMFISFSAPAMTADEETVESPLSKEGDFKEVFKGKPEGTPGGKPPKDPKPPPEPGVDKWAVVIGIANYQGIGNDLMYTDDDAVDMYNYLLSKGYPSDNIKLLLNNKASARGIQKAISWMDKAEGADSECVFFYSGHGSTYDGYNDGDTEYTDEGIVSCDMYLILDGQLKSMFAGYSSQKISFIFDSCFSGGMDDLAGPGRVVVTACGEEEYSWDGSAAMSNGVFTYYYMQGLSTYNTVEGAFTYGAPLAAADVWSMYGYTMTPCIYDQYTGDWAF